MSDELPPGYVRCWHCDGKGFVKCDCPDSRVRRVDKHPLNQTDWDNPYTSMQGYVVKQCLDCGRVFGIRYQWDVGTGSDDHVKDFGIGDPLELVTERHY